MELDRFGWLSQRVEAPIDADRQIVDPHHHLWDRNGSTYLANELLADTGGSHNVTHTVFVECRAKWDRQAELAFAPVGETRFVAGEAAEMAEREGADIVGIVSHANLLAGDGVEAVLEAHDAAGAGLFRGIRHATAFTDDPVFHTAHTGAGPGDMLRPAFVAGAQVLARMGFSFDAWLYHTQIAELVALAKEVPELTIVLDHLGGRLHATSTSPTASDIHASWRAAMTEAAACPNIVLKVGGIGMDNVFGTGWASLDAPPGSEQVASFWGDDVRWCIDTFGPSRCMLESNFPVDRQTLPYAVLWNAMQIMTDEYSESEKHDLFAATAARTYRLDLS